MAANAQSTAWSVQGLAAAGADPRRAGGGKRAPTRFLESLQQSDGSFRYSRISSQTPVWVTAQALAAIRLAPLPLKPAARRAAARVAAAAPAPRAAPAHRSARPRHRSQPSPARTAQAVAQRPVSLRPAANVSPRVREHDHGGGPDGLAVAAACALVLAACGALAWRLQAR
jgi:hypothetical protein